MTATHDLDISPSFQYLIALRGTIDAVSCAADLIPENVDSSFVGIDMLFKRLSERLYEDFNLVMSLHLTQHSKTS